MDFEEAQIFDKFAEGKCRRMLRASFCCDGLPGYFCSKTHFNSTIFLRFYSAQTQQDHPTTSEEDDTSSSVFDSSQYDDVTSEENSVRSSTWDEKYRERVKEKVFGEDPSKVKSSRILIKEEEKRRKTALLARTLLEAATERADEEGDEDKEDEVVKEEDQMSLSVGIIGAPNAGKSSLTNYMVYACGTSSYFEPLSENPSSVTAHDDDEFPAGTKVSAVSRKTNTTTHEVLGVMTKGKTQICFFDTPGLMLKKSGFPHKDMKARIESAWRSIDLYDVLIVIFDAHRHLTKPDSRVVRLIERMGSEANPNQKHLLCINKVDLIEKKKDLLKVAEEFKDLPGYERCFTISGLKGAGVKDLTKYLMEQASLSLSLYVLKRPWDEDPFVMSEEVMKNISLEVVREKLLHYIHQEIPYGIDHRLMDWKELRDGSLRIEQHLITHKISQRKILVGKNGSKIGRIGMEANEELRTIFKRQVHLVLMVRVKS
ncbi:GTP-binding protein ERG [Capsicum annuum]|uniref:GTP-binding protein ERG n=1 Tax=Capsicum annuum TaxID=4072 RepID=A0A2G3A9J6_CAPAN|nr:GTP-binding protein ERG [Capsicum annuum]